MSGNFIFPPSRWTQSQTLLAERRIIPCSTEVHWRFQNYAYEFGCHAWASHRRLLEYRWIKRIVWFLDRFHSVHSIRRETSRRMYVVRRKRLRKRQVTSRADHLWPELWMKLGRNAELWEKQKWSIEKPKLGNARRLRGIYFVDLEDKEFKETIRNARKKLETPKAPAMLCKTCKKSKNGETRSKTNDFKSKFACILEASECTRLRMEESPPNCHEDHIVGKGDNSLYYSVHKFIPLPQAMKIPAAKAAVDKECEKLEKIPAWALTKVRSKSEVIDEAKTKGAKVHFASLMDICHLKNAELETKPQKYKSRIVLRGDIVKDDSGSYAVFTEQGSSASQMTAAKIMDIISRLPGAFWEAIHLFQPVGCVRNKLQFRTVQQNQKSSLWTQDWGWTVYPHLIHWIWSSQFSTETRIRVLKNGDTCARTFLQHFANFKRERNLMEWSMIWTMLILFPQTSILRVKKLYCMCLKTTKQWSRWSS